MSEKTEAPDPKVSMTKGGAAATPGRRTARAPRADVPRVPTVQTIDLAGVAIGVMLVALWVRALSVLGSTDLLEGYYTRANAKDPKKGFNAADTVHQLRVGSIVSVLVITVAMVLLVGAMRRTRSASASRWGLLIILVLTGVPFYVIPAWGWPFLAQLTGVVAGVTGIAAIVLVFMPQSMRYFRECRNSMVPEELRGQPRPGLGSLFRPRTAMGGPAGSGAAGTGRPAAATRPAATRPAKQSSAKAKAKVRSDAEAVAKGAELARTRAKTSKTRRAD